MAPTRRQGRCFQAPSSVIADEIRTKVTYIGPWPVPHAVCVLPDGSGEGCHYFAYEVDLLAVHEEFEGQYAAGRPIDCRGLRPID